MLTLGNSKYKYMENRLTQSRANLKTKIPDISKTLDTVKYLESKKEEEVLSYFELADNVFAQAKISKPSSVSLWLGVCILHICYFKCLGQCYGRIFI
jgi:prefoldin subunit 5